MNEPNKSNSKLFTSDEFDLKDMLILLWDYKIFVTLFTLVGLFISIFYSLSIQNTYISYAKLIPVSEQSMSNQVGQLGGIAALAGIQVDPSSKSNDAIERLQSFEFFKNEILKSIENFSASLMAANSWSPDTGEIEYNLDSYDTNKGTWLKEAPSERKVYKAFTSKLDIKKEPGSSVLTISFEHISPIFAKSTLDKIIFRLNESERNYDEIQANKSIDYLNAQLSVTNINEIKDVLSELLKNEIQKIVLVKAKDEYIFKIIDSPFVPEEKAGPNRRFICIAGTFLSFIASIIFLLAYNFHATLYNNRNL
jgi:uncharacterized protein involved in exopolysaccharide biosynthesis